MVLDAELWQVLGMRVRVALRHGMIEPFLGGDWFAVPVVELTILPVDVVVPACLHVLVNMVPPSCFQANCLASWAGNASLSGVQ